MKEFTYLAEVKEKMTDAILKPKFIGSEKTKKDLVDFWGLEQDDIQWYRLFEVKEDGTKVEM